jgi:hypothetical protein
MNIIDLNLISEHYATLCSYLILKIHNTIGLLICTAYTLTENVTCKARQKKMADQNYVFSLLESQKLHINITAFFTFSSKEIVRMCRQKIKNPRVFIQ